MTGSINDGKHFVIVRENASCCTIAAWMMLPARLGMLHFLAFTSKTSIRRIILLLVWRQKKARENASGIGSEALMDGPWLLANNSNSSVSRIFLQWLWRLKSARESSAATKAEMPCCAPFLLANSSKCYIWRIFLIIMKIFKLARKRKPRLPLSARRSLLSLDLSHSQEWQAWTIKESLWHDRSFRQE